MCWSKRLVLLIALLGCGCGEASTAKLIENLKAPDEMTRIKAVRTLPLRKQDAAQVIPALIEALKDEDPDVRRGAADGLGTFHEQARDALVALQTSVSDPHPKVREAAARAQSLIDPQHFPDSSKPGPERGRK